MSTDKTTDLAVMDGTHDRSNWWLSSNTSYSPAISIDVLRAILTGSMPPEEWVVHLRAFFLEATPNEIDRFLRAHGISWEDAKQCYVLNVRMSDSRQEMDDYFLLS